MATLVTKTIKASGGDYTSRSSWEATENGDVVTADELRQGETYGSHNDTTQMIVDGGTTDSTRFLRLIPASGAYAQMPYDTGGTANRMTYAGSNAAIYVRDSYFQIIGQQIQCTSTSALTVCIWQDAGGGGDETLIDSCHLRGDGDSSANSHYGYVGTATGTTYAINNFVTNMSTNTGTRDGVGLFVNTSAGTSPVLYAYNNTVADGNFTDGIVNLNAANCTLVAKNNVVDGCATADFSGTFQTGTEYNASSDATAPGTNALINQTFSFVGGGDFHFSTGLSGVDLSADSVWPFSNDFDQDTRSGTWHRGADQVVSASGRIMSSLAGAGGLAGPGGLAGQGGGLAG